MLIDYENKENKDFNVKPGYHSTRIRKIVKEGSEEMIKPVKKLKWKEPPTDHFLIERLEPAAFDRKLEMDSINKLYHMRTK